MKRTLLLALGVLILAGASALFGIRQYFRGPGLDREIERLSALLEVRPAMNLADVGAGDGRMAARMAARLGPGGRMYATEIDPAHLASIRRQATTNVVPVEANERSTGLPEACCDAIYFRRVYHHVTDKESFLKGIRAALRPGGLVVVIDMKSPRWLPYVHHGIERERVERDLAAVGFTLERTIPRWSPIDYCLVFRKPAYFTGPR